MTTDKEREQDKAFEKHMLPELNGSTEINKFWARRAWNVALAWQAARANSGWLPISEAPKDGAEIFIYPQYRAASWDDSYGWSNEDAEEFVLVTHWMPLPTPPKGDN